MAESVWKATGNGVAALVVALSSLVSSVWREWT